jgi:hypothetical protein
MSWVRAPSPAPLQAMPLPWQRSPKHKFEARLVVSNRRTASLLVVVEPWVEDFTLLPGQELELLAVSSEQPPYFALVESDDRSEIYIENSVEDWVVTQGGKEIHCGHQRGEGPPPIGDREYMTVERVEMVEPCNLFLQVKPIEGLDLQFIYRAALSIYWNPDQMRLEDRSSSEESLSASFIRIARALRNVYGLELRPSEDVKWDEVPALDKIRIENIWQA